MFNRVTNGPIPWGGYLNTVPINSEAHSLSIPTLPHRWTTQASDTLSRGSLVFSIRGYVTPYPTRVIWIPFPIENRSHLGLTPPPPAGFPFDCIAQARWRWRGGKRGQRARGELSKRRLNGLKYAIRWILGRFLGQNT